jgi:hypothetical protein
MEYPRKQRYRKAEWDYQSERAKRPELSVEAAVA